MSAVVSTEPKKLHTWPPLDFVPEVTRWENEQAALWVLKHGITAPELRLYDIGYSQQQGGIVYPLKDRQDVVLGYQVRNFEREGPKYLTHRILSNSSLAFFSRKFFIGQHSTCVIVEDILSAIKVDRVLPAIALLGNSLNDFACSEIVSEFQNAVIFLDNDNPQVKRAQQSIASRLANMLEGRVGVVEAQKDPKAHTEKELRQILGGTR